MRRVLLWLAKAVGTAVFGAAFLVVVVMGCAFVVSTWLRVTGQFLPASGDLELWRYTGIRAAAGLVALAASGIFLRWLSRGDRRKQTGVAGPGGGVGRRSSRAAPALATFRCLGLIAFGLNLQGHWSWSWVEVLDATLLCYFGLQAAVCVHELGHLAAAAALGLRPHELRIGQGPVIAGGRWGELEVSWRLWYAGGFVRVTHDQERGWRRRHWLFCAGGPAAHVLLVVAGTWWWFGTGGASTPASPPRAAAVQLLCWEAWILLVNLGVFRGRAGGRPVSTDGAQLWTTFRLPAEAVRQRVLGNLIFRAERCWEQGRRQEAWSELAEATARAPLRPAWAAIRARWLVDEGQPVAAIRVLRSWTRRGGLFATETGRLVGVAMIDALVQANRAEKARRFARRLLDQVPADQRARALDELACLPLFRRRWALLADAEAWSREALALDPGAITLRGTRGAVLLEMGRAGEGVPLLREVWERSPAAIDAAVSAFYLALHARRQGRKTEMRRWRSRAAWFADAADNALVRGLIHSEFCPDGPATVQAPDEVASRIPVRGQTELRVTSGPGRAEPV